MRRRRRPTCCAQPRPATPHARPDRPGCWKQAGTAEADDADRPDTSRSLTMRPGGAPDGAGIRMQRRAPATGGLRLLRRTPPRPCPPHRRGGMAGGRLTTRRRRPSNLGWSQSPARPPDFTRFPGCTRPARGFNRPARAATCALRSTAGHTGTDVQGHPRPCIRVLTAARPAIPSERIPWPYAEPPACHHRAPSIRPAERHALGHPVTHTFTATPNDPGTVRRVRDAGAPSAVRARRWRCGHRRLYGLTVGDGRSRAAAARRRPARTEVFLAGTTDGVCAPRGVAVAGTVPARGVRDGFSRSASDGESSRRDGAPRSGRRSRRARGLARLVRRFQAALLQHHHPAVVRGHRRSASYPDTATRRRREIGLPGCPPVTLVPVQ